MYSDVDLSQFKHKDQFCVLDKYFIRGAECVIGENTCSQLGIAKGTKGVMEGLVWEEGEKDAPDIYKLPKGQVTRVPQPAFILVRVGEKIIPVGLRNDKIKLRGQKKYINFRNSPCDLLFAITYHKLQGLTLDKIILSIGKHPTAKLRVDLQSLYVGISRVHTLTSCEFFLLKKMNSHLTSLKRDPLLSEWLHNYSEDGTWKSRGFQDAQKQFLKNLKNETSPG